MNKLAIVIPAYKVEFFDFTLESISQQSCKDFTVYVGVDGKDDDFESIVNKYSSVIDIKYTKFKDNLGGIDLVSQWRRCVELIDKESWIWLFSDDDIMGPRCVESFYNTISKDDHYDLYHFDINAIDENNNVIFECRRFPSVINSLDFYKNKESDKLDSFVVEYIFSVDIYKQTGGFQNFDLAWGADTATWVKFGLKNGIKNIIGDKVYWRRSNLNITPNRNNAMSMRKFLISVDYYAWINCFFGCKSICRYNQYVFFRNFVFYCRILNNDQLCKILRKSINLNVITRRLSFVLYYSLPLLRLLKLLRSFVTKKNIQ